MSEYLAVAEEYDGGGDAVGEEEDAGYETLGAGVLRQIVEGTAGQEALWKVVKGRM